MKYCNKQSVSSGRTLHYLKRIFESLDEDQVKDFCEMNLAYLMDDGLRVLVSPDSVRIFGVIDYKVTLSFRSLMNKKWVDIRDQVIPFLTHLRNEYDLIGIATDRVVSPNLEFNVVSGVVSTYGSYPDFFHIDDVISDKFDSHRFNDDYKVLSIQFKIKGEKV